MLEPGQGTTVRFRLRNTGGREGEEVVIARDNRPLLRLVPLPPVGGRRRPGSAKGRIWMAPDFDRTPEDFEDYVG